MFGNKKVSRKRSIAREEVDGKKIINSANAIDLRNKNRCNSIQLVAYLLTVARVSS
jgi:hypothetical protein